MRSEHFTERGFGKLNCPLKMVLRIDTLTTFKRCLNENLNCQNIVDDRPILVKGISIVE